MGSRRGRPKAPILGTGPNPALARRLRLLCENADLTLTQLAVLTTYSIYTLSTAMNGRTTPTWAVCSAIVEACGGDSDEWKSAWRDAAGHAVPLIAPPLHQPDAHELAVIPPGQHARMGGGSARGGVDPPISGSYARATAVRPARGDVDVVPTMRRMRPLGPPPIPVTARTPAEFNDFVLRLRLWAGNPSVRDLASAMDLSRGTVQNFLFPKNFSRLARLEVVTKFLVACGVRDTLVLAEWAYTWRRLMYNDTLERRAETRADKDLPRIGRQLPSRISDPHGGTGSSVVA